MKDRNKHVRPNINAFDMSILRRYEFILILLWGIFSMFGYVSVIQFFLVVLDDCIRRGVSPDVRDGSGIEWYPMIGIHPGLPIRLSRALTFNLSLGGSTLLVAGLCC